MTMKLTSMETTKMMTIMKTITLWRLYIGSRRLLKILKSFVYINQKEKNLFWNYCFRGVITIPSTAEDHLRQMASLKISGIAISRWNDWFLLMCYAPATWCMQDQPLWTCTYTQLKHLLELTITSLISFMHLSEYISKCIYPLCSPLT